MTSRPVSPAPQVLVVDGHDSSRIGLLLILHRAEGVGECFAAADDERAVALAGHHRPEVALVDISQQGPFAGSLATALRRAAPGIRIVLTSHCAQSASAAIRAVSPSAFLPAGSSAKAIVAAVLAPPGSELPTAEPDPVDSLTPREREVLIGLVAGSTNREIGAEIHLGPDAVKKYASSIFRKLGVRNRTEAARIARDALIA